MHDQEDDSKEEMSLQERNKNGHYHAMAKADKDQKEGLACTERKRIQSRGQRRDRGQETGRKVNSGEEGRD